VSRPGGGPPPAGLCLIGPAKRRRPWRRVDQRPAGPGPRWHPARMHVRGSQ